MATIGNIKSIKEQHSVKEAVVTFCVQPMLSELLKYKLLIEKSGALFGEYQNYEPIKNVEMVFEPQKEEPVVRTTQIGGFKLLSFASGELNNLIQGINQPNRALFTFNTLKYVNWASFWEKVKNDARKIAEFSGDCRVISMSLLYVDEFLSVNPKDFSLSQIFNLKSKYVPQLIGSGDLMDYNLSFKKQENEKSWTENIVVKVNNLDNSNTISVVHNISYSINPVNFRELLLDEDLNVYMCFAHTKNKEMLSSLLQTNVIKMIGL